MAARSLPGASVGKFDSAIKVLLRTEPAAFLRLALGAPVPVRSVAAEEVELPATSVRLADKVLRYQRASGARVHRLHFEIEAEPKRTTPRRVHGYFTLLHREFTSLSSVLIVLKPGRRRIEPRDEYVVRDPFGAEVLRFRFRLLKLWEHDAAALQAIDRVALLPLVPFTSGATAHGVRRAMRTLAGVRDVERRADLQVALAVFAEAVFPGPAWSAMIPEEVLVKSELFARVHELGRAEGRVEGRVEMVSTLLRVRLGRGAARWTKLVAAAEHGVLVRLIEALAAVDGKGPTLAVLEDVLGRAPARRRRPAARRSPRT